MKVNKNARTTPQSRAMLLQRVRQGQSARSIAKALGISVRARGMSEIPKAAGITREARYKALRAGSEPRFDTIYRVCTALGVRLVAQPVRV